MFKIVNGGRLPTKATKYSACVDLYANADVTIGAGETKLIPLGVAIDLNRGFLDEYALHENRTDDGQDFGEYYEDLVQLFSHKHYLQLMLRSSLSKHLIIANGVGIVDCDYTPSCKVSKKIENDLCDEFIPIEKDDEIKCENCQNFNQNEIMIRVHNPVSYNYSLDDEKQVFFGDEHSYTVKKGDRVAQITLLEHKGYLMGCESNNIRNSGFGSTGS